MSRAFLGYRGPEAFAADLSAHLGSVENHYAELFEEAPSLAGPGNLVFTGAEDDPETLGDPGAARLCRSARGRGDGARLASRPHARDAQPAGARDPDRAGAGAAAHLRRDRRIPTRRLRRFDQFLSRLPAGVQLFSLFQANPGLLRWSPTSWPRRRCWPSNLAQRPALLDAVLTREFFAPLPDRAALAADLARELVGGARDFEDTLDLLRRWANERRFQVGVQLLRRGLDATRRARRSPISPRPRSQRCCRR